MPFIGSDVGMQMGAASPTEVLEPKPFISSNVGMQMCASPSTCTLHACGSTCKGTSNSQPAKVAIQRHGNFRALCAQREPSGGMQQGRATVC